ncbi:hypothetical protein [Chengkuizengella axinellae]|uniref:Uncharacterized protein n=1 Tax=Chengkuizengella axinellae TaxID=3064388 RepID=A0ABT9J5A9_9BACL|nr:hypothetical protein [Chengkuizengella sp. 2205SS18-9]MDP5276787.1 hypothetical protein [Chengkuizengella sp. 2205SS18-9]
MNNETLTINSGQLLESWQSTLPAILNKADSVDVRLDNANSNALNIHISTAGHAMYTFDFRCTYEDDRKVDVSLIDVEQNNKTIDEKNEVIQTLAEDYVRHIHECAQTLQSITHS